MGSQEGPTKLPDPPEITTAAEPHAGVMAWRPLPQVSGGAQRARRPQATPLALPEALRAQRGRKATGKLSEFAGGATVRCALRVTRGSAWPGPCRGSGPVIACGYPGGNKTLGGPWGLSVGLWIFHPMPLSFTSSSVARDPPSLLAL